MFVQAVLRHGDRSGMSDIPYTDKSSWDCGIPESDHHARAVFEDFSARYEAPDCIVQPPQSPESAAADAVEVSAAGDAVRAEVACGAESVGKTTPPGPASHGLSAGHLRPGDRCEHGQLTHTGMVQHMRLGALFRARLGGAGASWAVSGGDGAATRGGAPLLEPARAGDLGHVSVSSTNYGRTALSAASFWYGLSPTRAAGGARAGESSGEGGLTGAAPGLSLPFEGEPAFAGLPPAAAPGPRVLAVAPREMDPLLASKAHHRCPVAQRIADRVGPHRRAFRTLSPALGGSVAALAARGGAPASARAAAASDQTLSVADLINTRVCTGQPMPCALGPDGNARPEAERRAEEDGSGACVAAAFVAAVLRDSDRDYGRRLGGPDVAMLMYPALRSLVGQLRNRWEGRTGLAASFRFAHDTTVYPLLAALGVGDHEWPSYAARIVLELWSLRAGEGREGSGALPLVRVLYQGEDITGLLRCARSWGSADAADVAAGWGAGDEDSPDAEAARLRAAAWLALSGSACTLDSLEAQLAATIQPHRTYAEACALAPSRPAARDASPPGATPDEDGGGSNGAGPF